MPGIDSYTKLMLHCNGADGSATFVDDSNAPHTVTANGNMQIDTSQSKFGGASGLSDGTTDWLEIADHADWDFGTNDYTIDMWIRINSLAAVNTICARYSGENKDSWLLDVLTTGKIRMYAFNSVGARSDVAGGGGWQSTTVLSINTWYHIAVVQTSDKLQVYINGTKDIDLNPFAQNISNTIPFIICAFNTSGASSFNGWIDEFRVSKGIARWTSNFTPETVEYDSTVLNTSSLNQRYALDAPNLLTSSLNQRYALDAYILNLAALNQRYALDASILNLAVLNQRYALSGVVLYGTSLNQRYGLDTPTGPHLTSLNQRYILNGYHIPATVYHAVTYTLTLTGAPDGLSDIVLPMSSFQTRLKAGDPSWLSVIVPSGRVYADNINARPNGELVITRNGVKEDGSPESIEIARVALETIRTDEGPFKSSATLSGHKTTAAGSPKGVALTFAFIKSVYDGKIHVESKMDSNVRPGDEVELDSQVFTVGEILFTVNPRFTKMRITEA